MASPIRVAAAVQRRARKVVALRLQPQLAVTEHDPHPRNGTGNGNGEEEPGLAAAKRAFDQRRQQHAWTARDLFQRFAHRTSTAVGSPWAFGAALLVVIIWALSGKLFGFSDTWQLIINTGTTVVTFLMVFLIQSTQNRDAKAIHLKLDELIRTKRGARNAMVDLEHCTDEELDEIEREFERIRKDASRTAKVARK